MRSVASTVRAVYRPDSRARADGNGLQRLRAMFDGAVIGIGICSLDGRVLEGNSALSRMLGYSREELAGMHARDFHPGDFQQDEVLLSELLGGQRESFRLEKRYRRKDGSYLWGHLTVSLVREGGKPSFLVAMLEDITDRKREAEQMRETEKMEVIGRLAGGIAHDFNNLLTGILLYCDLLASGLEPGCQLRHHVEEIRMAGEQGAALTQQLLAIARKQAPQPRAILLNDVVTSTGNLLRRLIGEQIELVTILAPGLATVLADEAQLRQVLLNLVLNARDAMPQGGRITVNTRAARLPNGAKPGVSLLVEDNGCGMNAETRARLFEPFFTTKQAGHGTGLGLPTVQRIVTECGGAVRVDSKPGHGTRVEVLFPALGPASEARPFSPAFCPAATILLVDDQAGVRASMQHIVRQAGYRVLTASTGKRAMTVFAAHLDEINLLIADGMMPGMTGQELADKLLRQKPTLKVLLVSGFQESTSSILPVIRKPFTGPVLIECIREVLASKGGLPC